MLLLSFGLPRFCGKPHLGILREYLGLPKGKEKRMLTWETVYRVFGTILGLLAVAGIIYMWLDPMRRWAMGILAIIIGITVFALTVFTAFALGEGSGLSPLQTMITAVVAIIVFAFGVACVKTSREGFL